VYELIGIITIAFLLDLFLGDPRYRFHPIRVIGKGIFFLEKFLRRLGLEGKAGGIILVVVIEAAFLSLFLFMSITLHTVNFIIGLGFDLFICYSCIALKDLIHHINPVICALETGSIPEARKKIALIVGRDVNYLDDQGISRAAIETLAENFVDGFLSPVLWYLTGGILAHILGLYPLTFALTLMLAFKIASTLDSMVGYRSRIYAQFGWAGAKLDDLMNLFPARLSLVFLFIGSVIGRLHPLEGLKVAVRDRLKHDSPNAAHPESFVAGALNIRLGGPTRYPDGLKNKPWLGNGSLEPGPEHIRRAEFLIRYSSWFTIFSILCILLILS